MSTNPNVEVKTPEVLIVEVPVNPATTPEEVAPGRVMIYRECWGSKPMLTNIGSITKKFWIKTHVPSNDGKMVPKTFRPNSGYGSNKEWQGALGSNGYLYLYSKERFDEYTKIYTDNEKVKAEKKEREALKKAKKDAEEKAKIETVKKLCGTVEAITLLSEVLPDGSRFYVLNVPVNPEYVTRKNGSGRHGSKIPANSPAYERLVIRLVSEIHWFDSKEKVEAFMTFANGSSSSWGSCSGEFYNTDDEAIWGCLTDVYYRA